MSDAGDWYDSDTELFDDNESLPDIAPVKIAGEDDDEAAPVGDDADEDEVEETEDNGDEIDEVVKPIKSTIIMPDHEYVEFTRVVPDHMRQTSNILSEFEQTELISIRSEQISRYNNPFVDCVGLSDPTSMAGRELSMRRSPLMISRIVGEIKADMKRVSVVEHWDPNLMVHKQK